MLEDILEGEQPEETVLEKEVNTLVEDINKTMVEYRRLQEELEKKKQALLYSKNHIFMVEGLKDNTVYISSNLPPREDVLNVLRSIRSRVYLGERKLNSLH